MADSSSSSSVSVRTSEATSSNFTRIYEGSGYKTKGEFLESLLSVYSVSDVQKPTTDTIIAPALYAVDELTRKLTQILNGAGEELRILQEGFISERETFISEHEKKIEDLEQKISAEKEKYTALQENYNLLMGSKAELETELNQAKSTISDKTTLNSELMRTNAAQTDKISALEKDLTAAAQLASSNDAMKQRINELEKELVQSNMDRKLEVLEIRQKLQDEYTEKMTSYEEKIARLLNSIPNFEGVKEVKVRTKHDSKLTVKEQVANDDE